MCGSRFAVLGALSVPVSAAIRKSWTGIRLAPPRGFDQVELKMPLAPVGLKSRKELQLVLSKLLQYPRDIDSQRPERVSVEPVRLSLGGAEEISHRGSTQPIEKSQNSALLDHERRPSVEQSL